MDDKKNNKDVGNSSSNCDRNSNGSKNCNTRTTNNNNSTNIVSIKKILINRHKDTAIVLKLLS